MADHIRLALEDFEALGVVEDERGLYLPTTLRRRGRTGRAETQEEVLLAMPSTMQRFAARRMARAFFVEELGLDEEKDRSQFSDVENYAILTFAVRDPKTRGQLEPDIRSLVERFSDRALAEAWARLNVWVDMMDPRFGDLKAEELWQVVAAVSRGNLLPLVRMPTYAQTTCIALMAAEALASPNAPSWLHSPATSGSGSSPGNSSSESSGPESSPRAE